MGAWTHARRLVRSLAAPLALALAFAACHRGAKQSGGAGASAGGGPQGQPVPVDVAQVTQQPVPVEVRAIGAVEALATVQVRAQVGGVLQRVHVDEGEEVQAGQVLFTIDQRPYAAAVRQIEAVIARDRAQAQSAAHDARRFARLAKQNYVTQQQAESTAAQADALAATVHGDEAQLEQAHLNLEYCTIRAPITGKLGAVLIQAGNVVKANDLPLVVINQIRPIRVSFAVPSEYLSQVQARMRGGTLLVEARAPGEKGPPHRGKLTFVNNQVDPTTGTLLLKAEFPNDDEALWPGQLVDVRLVLAVQRNAVTAPSAAVQQGQEGTYVFVVKDGTAESRKVAVDRQMGEVTVVAQGLRPGEQVVTDGQLRLTPGARVNIRHQQGGAAGSLGGGPQGQQTPQQQNPQQQTPQQPNPQQNKPNPQGQQQGQGSGR